jgi:predicted ATPase/DNA-binding CsgD family transcriptional regulator/transcriptional regulator with XRE-family HTH domain
MGRSRAGARATLSDASRSRRRAPAADARGCRITETATDRFGPLLRRLRLVAALSQEELAERSGLSARGISALETGYRATPRPETVRLLADALGLDAAARAELVAAARPEVTNPADARPRAVSIGGQPLPLPVPPTRLVGREQEVAALCARLRREEVRLLTLTGPGGVGKTRLALAVAAVVADDFPDGVPFVPLAPITDPALVPSAIITALGVRDVGDEQLVFRLQSVLRHQQLLLLLDNFEHVIEASPIVADVLETCPGVTILVTSRVRLRVSGEHEVPIAPLGLVALDRHHSVEEVATSDAVRLFIARAEAIQPDLALTPENAVAVAAICRRLDGLPLAIELAAARVKVLPPAALLARLDRRLPLLTGGARDLPARQQTMRDAIGWSYDLLSPEEQVLFRRLAVFAGGFTLEAAETVVSEPGEPEIDPLEGVASLLDKSLLRQEAGPGGEPRFAMLETVREFALEQLAAGGEDASIRQRHASWYLTLVEAVGRDLESGGAEAAWFARLDTELDNLRAALAWFDAADEPTNVLRLLSAISGYWFVRPYGAEVRRWLEPALQAAPDAPIAVRVEALHVAAITTSFLGDAPAAVAYAEAEVALARELGDPLPLGRAHYDVGLAWAFSGDVARAAVAYEEAVSLLRTTGVPLWEALALAELGDTRLMMGDVAEAVPLLDEALALHRRSQFPVRIAVTLGERAHAARMQGDQALASRLFIESMTVAMEIGSERFLLGAVAGLAGVALALGQPERAARLLGAVEAAGKTSGGGRIAHAAHTACILAEVRASLPEPVFVAAWEEGWALPFADARADAMALAASTLEPPPPVPGDTSSFGLTARELDVLRLLVEGHSDRQIGEALFIGARTVQTHVANLFAKLGVNTRAEAAVVAVRRGIV